MSKKNWETYFNAVKKEDWESAKTVLQSIAQNDGNNPKIHLQLGDIYQRTGDLMNAIASYHQAAWLLRSMGFLQKAITVYKTILGLDPYNAEAMSRSNELMMELETAASSKATFPTANAAGLDSLEEFASYIEGKSSDSIAPELFSEMPEEEIQLILNRLTVKSFRDSAIVIEEGDSGESMFIIKSGKAKVIAHISGKELNLATLEAGELFGEVAFLTGRLRTASVIAEGSLEVYEISRIELENIIEKNPSLLQKIEDCYEYRVLNTIKKTEP